MRGKDAEKLAETQPRRGQAAPPELLQRDVVHLVGTRTRRIARRPHRYTERIVVGLRDRLAGLIFEAAAHFGQPLLALAGQLLHRHELLLHGQQIGLHFATQLHQVRLLRCERSLDGGDGGKDRIALRGARRFGAHQFRLQRLDL